MNIRRSIAAGAVLTAVLMLLVSVATAGAASPRNFVAPLSGDEEFPPVDTQARGVGIFQLSADGTELSYRLIATNIDDVHMAHIHCCTGPMSNAGIAVWLYPSAPPPVLIPGRHTGTLATGTITADDIVGPALLTDAADPLAALVEQIMAGNAYVNVHTEANPGGEIRGQLP